MDLVGIEDADEWLRVVIRSRAARPVCEACGGVLWSKGERPVGLVHLPVFGRPVRLRWQKRRWPCPDQRCVVGSFIEQYPQIPPERALLTSRAAPWAVTQLGRLGRTIQDVAAELGCDRHHTVNKGSCSPSLVTITGSSPTKLKPVDTDRKEATTRITRPPGVGMLLMGVHH